MAVIARGDIVVQLNDRGAKRELAQLSNYVKTTFRDLNRQKASPRIRLEHDDFDRAYKKAKAEIEDLKKQRATAVLRFDVDGVAKATSQIKVLEEQARVFAAKRYEATVRINVDRDSQRAVDALTDTIRKLTSGKFFTNIGVDVNEADLRRVEQEVQSSINALERRKAKLIVEADATGVATTIAEIKTLDAVLKDVQRRIQTFDDARLTKPLNIRADLDDRSLRLMRRELLNELRSLEKERITLHIEGDTEGLDRLNRRINTATADLERLTSRRWQLRLPNFRRSDEEGRGFSNTIERLNHLVREGRSWWNDFGGSILGAGIRLGPLMLRLRAAVAVMTYLAPLLISLGGAFISLGGALYSGFLGALGPATAGVAALGLGMGGIIAVAAPLVSDIGKASKATDKYNKAVRESGKDSTRAKNALEQMRNVMGNVGPETAKAFQGFNKLGGEWRKLTAGARPTFFKTFADGVQTARDLMPLFARESTRTFEVAAGGVRKWLAGLRGNEARGIFRRIFQGAQESIPNLQAAFGNLGTFLGRVAKAAMPLWEEFTRTLERWTGGWADAAKDGDAVRNFLDRTKDALVDVGQAVGATGRLLHNLFMGSSAAGQGLLDTITNLFNRWADFLGTTEGQNAMQDFFSKATAMATTFFGIVGNLGRVFFGIAETLAPIAKLVADITRLLTSIPHMDKVIAGGIGAILLIRQLSKVLAIVTSIKAAILAIKAGGGISAALAAGNIARMQQMGRLPMATTVATEAAATAAGARAGSTRAAGKAGGEALASAGGAAAGAATRVSLLSRALVGLRVGFTALTGPVGLTATALTLGTIGLNKFFDATSKTADAASKLRGSYDLNIKAAKTYREATGQLTATGQAYQQSQLTVEQTERRLNQLRRQGKQGTQEYRQAVLDNEAAVAQYNQAAKNQERVEKSLKVSSHARVGALKAQIEATKALPESAERTARLLRLQRELAFAHDREIAANINIGRSRRGLAAITGEAATRMGFLVKQFAKLPKGDTVRKFFVQADTRQAQAAIRNVGKLQDAGVKDSTIIKIFASSGDAETKLAKLRALAQNIDKLNPSLTVTAKDNATPRINRVRAVATALIRNFVSTFVGRDNASGVARKAFTSASRLVRAFIASLQARDGASGVIAGALNLLRSFDGASATATITTMRKTVYGRERAPAAGVKYPGSKGPGGAMGGANPRTARGTRGEWVRKTTFLVGEENGSPEVVIASNPRYRKRNLGLLKQAAVMLGVPHVGKEIKEVLDTPYMKDSWESFFPAFAKGGVTKKERAQMKKRKRLFKKRTKIFSRGTRRLSRRWQPEVRQEQQKVEKIERNIKDRVEKRNQDEQQFSIDLDNNPIIVTDAEGNDTINEGARNDRLNKLTNLQQQTQAIITRYNDLKKAIEDAITKINKAMDNFRKRRESISTKKYGSKGAKDLRKQIDEKLGNLKGDRTSAEERLHEIGNETERGEQRGERLQWNQYEAEKRQTRQQTVASAAATGGTTTDANAAAQLEQAKARASFFERTSQINEAALRAFSGPGDIGYGASKAVSAVTSGARAAAAGIAGGAVGAAAAAQAAFGSRDSLSATPSVGGAEGGAGGPTVVIQTLHPGDPATLDAIGRAATGGIGLQGNTISPRVATGL